MHYWLKVNIKYFIMINKLLNLKYFKVTKVRIRICVMLENGIRDAEHQMIPMI